MPFVFVHGVNNRAGAGYDKGVEERHKFLKQATFSQLSFNKNPILLDPYWGDLGAKARWNNRSTPSYDLKYAAMGAEDKVVSDIVTSQVDFVTDEKAAVLKIARKTGLTSAIDVLMLQAVREGKEGEQLNEVFALLSKASDYAEKNESPEWLNKVEDDDAFIFKLSQQLKKDPADVAAMGVGDTWEKLKESAARIGSAVGDKTSELLVRALREKIQQEATRFMGDAFVYFRERWNPANGQPALITRDGKVPGKIPSLVLQALMDAEKAKTPEDPYLIVMAHSMGGNIIYDLSSDFLIDKDGKPILEIDLLITVGSQFAMFQEINMFEGVKLPDVITEDTRISKPKTIKHWINCFDKNDIFGYCASAVFGDVQDFEFDTGFGVGGAHGGYFQRLSFYQRLGKRIQNILAPVGPAPGKKP